MMKKMISVVLCLCMLAALLPAGAVTVHAAETHVNHKACNGLCGGSCTHDVGTWISWEEAIANGKLTKGDRYYYPTEDGLQVYLTQDLSLDKSIQVGTSTLHKFTLCLNGNNINLGGDHQIVAFKNNSAYGDVILTDCTTEQNTVGGKTYIGGVIYGGTDLGAVDAQYGFEMYGGNIAQNTNSGVVAEGTSSRVSIMGGTISDNSTSYDGGGIYGNQSTITVGGNAIIQNNTAGESGGGIGTSLYGATVTVTGNAKIIGNKAGSDQGGGIAVDGNSSSPGNLTLSGNAEISGNTTNHMTLSAGVWVDSGTFTVSGNVKIYGNTNGSGAQFNTLAWTIMSIASPGLGNDARIYVSRINKFLNAANDPVTISNSGTVVASSYSRVLADQTGQYVVLNDNGTPADTADDYLQLTLSHTHDWNTDQWLYDADSHWRTCKGCSAIDETPHTFDQRIQSAAYQKNAASCLGEGEYYLSCLCGAHGTATFTIPALAHAYTYTGSGATVTESCPNGCAHLAAATVTAPADLAYDGNPKEAGISYTGTLLRGNNLSVHYQKDGSPASEVRDAGDYIATVTLDDGNGGTVSGSVPFTVTRQTGKTLSDSVTLQYFDTAVKTVDIGSKITALCTAGDAPSYGGITWGASIASASVTDGKLHFQLVSGLSGAAEIHETITLTVTGLRNYDGVAVRVDVTVTPDIPVTVNMDGIILNGKTYDGRALTYTGAAVGTGGEPVAFLYEWLDADGNKLATAPIHAGDYQLKATVTTAGYSGSAAKAVQIRKREVTIQPASAEITAGNGVPTPTLIYTGLVEGETLIPRSEPGFAVTDSIGNAVDLSRPIRVAGSYTIVWTNAAATAFDGAENYSVIKLATAPLTVHASTVVIPPFYTLTFEENGGSEIGRIAGIFGYAVELSRYTTTRDGYTFAGWYLDEALTTPVTSVTLTRNTKVYAAWTANTPVNPDLPYTPGLLNTTEHYAYIIGYDDGLVRPEGKITRAEVATVFFRLLREDVREKHLSEVNAFADVDRQAWYNISVSTMAAMGIVEGYEGKYRPNDPITRAEFTAIAARFAEKTGDVQGSFSDVSGHWAELEIQIAASHGWVEGYEGAFRPDDPITRAEAMAIVNRALWRMPEDVSDLLPGMTVWADNTDTEKWYYLHVQEASCSHKFVYKSNSCEHWTEHLANPDWSRYQR